MKTNLLLAAAIAVASLGAGLAQAAQPTAETAVVEAKHKFKKKFFYKHYYYYHKPYYYYHCPYPYWSWKAKKYCY